LVKRDFDVIKMHGITIKILKKISHIPVKRLVVS